MLVCLAAELVLAAALLHAVYVLILLTIPVEGVHLVCLCLLLQLLSDASKQGFSWLWCWVCPLLSSHSLSVREPHSTFPPDPRSSVCTREITLVSACGQAKSVVLAVAQLSPVAGIADAAGHGWWKKAFAAQLALCSQPSAV